MGHAALCALQAVDRRHGVLILSRHPRHAVGWLLCVLGLVNALTADLMQGWGLRAAAEGWAGGLPVEWLALSSWPLTMPLFVAILLLFPTGHLPNRRWSTVVWLSAAGTAIAATGSALDPDTGQVFFGGRNPYAVPGLLTDTLGWVGLTLIVVALAVALVAAVNRLRRSTGDERQQLKWFAAAAAYAGVALPLVVALWTVTPVAHAAGRHRTHRSGPRRVRGDPALPPLRHRRHRRPDRRLRHRHRLARRWPTASPP